MIQLPEKVASGPNKLSHSFHSHIIHGYETRGSVAKFDFRGRPWGFNTWLTHAGLVTKRHGERWGAFLDQIHNLGGIHIDHMNIIHHNDLASDLNFSILAFFHEQVLLANC